MLSSLRSSSSSLFAPFSGGAGDNTGCVKQMWLIPHALMRAHAIGSKQRGLVLRDRERGRERERERGKEEKEEGGEEGKERKEEKEGKEERDEGGPDNEGRRAYITGRAVTHFC